MSFVDYIDLIYKEKTASPVFFSTTQSTKYRNPTTQLNIKYILFTEFASSSKSIYKTRYLTTSTTQQSTPNNSPSTSSIATYLTPISALTSESLKIIALLLIILVLFAILCIIMICLKKYRYVFSKRLANNASIVENQAVSSKKEETSKRKTFKDIVLFKDMSSPKTKDSKAVANANQNTNKSSVIQSIINENQGIAVLPKSPTFCLSVEKLQKK